MQTVDNTGVLAAVWDNKNQPFKTARFLSLTENLRRTTPRGSSELREDPDLQQLSQDQGQTAQLYYYRLLVLLAVQNYEELEGGELCFWSLM